ncbi:GNAT family N-acetyltransferase [Herbidospora sp. RD11066]
MIRAAAPGDEPALNVLLHEAFAFGGDVQGPIGLDARYVLERDGAVCATAAVYPFGQYFGGRELKATGVGAVAVGTDSRGSGAGGRFMDGLLQRMRADGVAVSTLYPSVPAAYRKVGWEIAGDHRTYRTPLEALPVVKGAEVLPWTRDDLPAIANCYRRFALMQQGLLARTPAWWDRVHSPAADPTAVFRRAVWENGQVTGYTAYRKKAADKDLPYYFDVEVSEVVWTTPAASDALLTHFSRHRGLGRDLLWAGPPNDPWLSRLGGLVARTEFSYPWMLRIVDVAAALSGRGYARWADATVRLDLTDPNLTANTGHWLLSVSGGEATVEAASEHDVPVVSLGSCELAALYTGWASAHDLLRSGRIAVGDPEAADALDRIFTGQPAWMPEMF